MVLLRYDGANLWNFGPTAVKTEEENNAMSYTIMSDTACDISPAIAKEWGVDLVSMTFRFEKEEREYGNADMPIGEFYGKIKNGAIAKTAAINPEKFTEAFEEVLKSGSDLLYLGFSSGLSTTYNSAVMAANELREKYPERKIITVDTLCGSAGQGLLLYLAVQKKKGGATIEETAEYVEENKLNLCHWFTVDDLVYLKRGGRISPTLAFVGNILGIKPVLHVDNEGHLVNVLKARGRKKALDTIIEKYGELALCKNEGTVFISHAVCESDVEYFKNKVAETYGINVDLVTDIGPVIGAHSGPGTFAFFFLGKER